jgi:large subunit ribosomal protein L29
MALPKIAEVTVLTDEELAAEIIAVKRNLFDLRLRQATRRLDKTHQFKHNRHKLAQLLTVEHQRKAVKV